MPSEADARLRPLAGLRVLDFTALPPGAACAVLLADLGAEVVRVESPALAGKPSLVIGQPALSRAKRSMTLDTRDPRANEVLLRLAPSFDIVLENARPGAMEARGFGYAQACAANPGIVWCAITGFGQTGPYADHAGHDISYLAHSGLLGALAGDQPWQPAMALALQAGALTAVVAIQGALIERGRTGEGAFVDVALAEAAGWFLNCGVNPLSPAPLALPATPDRRLYACADGRSVAVACAEPRTWNALCDVLGVPDLKPTLRQAQEADRVAARLAAVFAGRPAAEWVALATPAGAAVTVVNHGAQLLDDPHIRARGGVATVAGAPVPASAVRIASGGKASGTATTPPPVVGADTDDVLRRSGFAEDEIASCRAAGLV